MKIIETRELTEAKRLLGSDRIGFAYAETANFSLRALSVDGVARLIQVGIHHGGETFENFGSLGGCSQKSEGDALADVQQALK